MFQGSLQRPTSNGRRASRDSAVGFGEPVLSGTCAGRGLGVVPERHLPHNHASDQDAFTGCTGVLLGRGCIQAGSASGAGVNVLQIFSTSSSATMRSGSKASRPTFIDLNKPIPPPPPPHPSVLYKRKNPLPPPPPPPTLLCCLVGKPMSL